MLYYNQCMQKPKVALVHEYLNQYGGAEKTLEELLDVFPESPIYTGMYIPGKVSDKINNRTIIAPKSALLSKFPKYLTFLMPLIFESFDLDRYDLIISDGTAWPKSVLTKPDQLHISYIHTPPRFLYKYSVESSKRNKWYFKPFVGVIDHWLRIWDYNAAQRPDYLLVNSKEIQKRVQKFYGRESTVIYPPVNVHYNIAVEKNNLTSPYFLALGRLSAYKNIHLLVQAFNLLEKPLVVVGTGVEETELKKMAKDNIIFTGQVSETEKHKYLEGCLGLINPVVDEDFGIVPVEALAHGKPVLMHRSGGTMETVIEGVSGMYLENVNLDHIVQKIKEFEEEIRKGTYNPAEIKKSVLKFDRGRFKQEFETFVNDKWKEHLEKHPA